MPDLIPLEFAKARMRVDFCDDDADIGWLISAASEAVLCYLKEDGYSSFYDGTSLIAEVPFSVRVATAHLVRVMKDQPGDQDSLGFGDYGDLPKPVVSLLYRLRDPAYR